MTEIPVHTSLNGFMSHQVKLRVSFMKQRLRKARSRCPLGAVTLYTRHTAHACTGGLTSLRLNSYAMEQSEVSCHIGVRNILRRDAFPIFWQGCHQIA